MLQVEGLRRFQYSIQATKARIEGKVTQRYQEYVAKVFVDLVEHTPQWSGHLASNWHVLLTKDAAPSVDNWYKKGHTGNSKASTYKPVQRGDGEAMHAAIDRAMPKIQAIRWNTKVTFANPVDYAEEIEAESTSVRPVNLVAGRVAMAQYIISKYSRGEVVLGGGLS